MLLRGRFPRPAAGNGPAHARAARRAGAAQGPCRRRLPQRHPSLGRRLRPGSGAHAVAQGTRRYAAAHHGPRNRRRGGVGRPRRDRPAARRQLPGLSLDRLRQLPVVPGGPGEPLHGPGLPGRAPRRRLRRPRARAALPLPDRHRRPGPGADRTLRLLRPDHLCRAEEDRRADLSPASRGDLRRGRPGTDVPDAHQGAGRRRRHRGGHRPRQAPGGAGGRRAGGHRRRGPGRGAADHRRPPAASRRRPPSTWWARPPPLRWPSTS